MSLTSLENIIEDNNKKEFKISGKLKDTETIWNNFLDICKKNIDHFENENDLNEHFLLTQNLKQC